MTYKYRALHGGGFYRPIDTKIGKAGWVAEIYYEEYIPITKAKTSRNLNCNWQERKKQFGPFRTEKECRDAYSPFWQEIMAHQNINFVINKGKKRKSKKLDI